jgi:hypothetical protein
MSWRDPNKNLRRSKDTAILCSGQKHWRDNSQMPESTPPCSSHAFAQYHNEVQDMQAKSDELVRKNKSLRNKNKGALLSC